MKLSIKKMNTFIFVRCSIINVRFFVPFGFRQLLKEQHVMIRVGGGWDTLEHFLSRHDIMNVVYMKRNNRSKTSPTSAAIYGGDSSTPLKVCVLLANNVIIHSNW